MWISSGLTARCLASMQKRAHGLGEQNRVTLEKFVEYAQEQGYIPYRPAIDEFFAAVEV